VAKLLAEVQTVIEQRKQAQTFLNKVKHHFDVAEVDKEDAPRTITPAKPLNKTNSKPGQITVELRQQQVNQTSRAAQDTSAMKRNRTRICCPACCLTFVAGDSTKSDKEYTPVHIQFFTIISIQSSFPSLFLPSPNNRLQSWKCLQDSLNS
jgi:hypothetical protein